MTQRSRIYWRGLITADTIQSPDTSTLSFVFVPLGVTTSGFNIGWVQVQGRFAWSMSDIQPSGV
jgi:hypothetical protein